VSDNAIPKTAKRFWRFLISPAALARLAILAACGSILGFFGKLHWFLDLFNHLQAQYFVALLIITVVLAVWRKPVEAAVAIGALMIPTARLAELYTTPIAKSDGPTLRVASFNVLGSNDRYDETIDWILQTDPDFIYLPECDAKWQQALKPLAVCRT